MESKQIEIKIENTNNQKESKSCCSFFNLSVLFSFLFQLFDIGSDIYVLIDLYYKEIYYFYCSLTILLFTSFINSFFYLGLSSNKGTKPDQTLEESLEESSLNKKNIPMMILNFLLGLFHINIFKEVYYTIKNEQKTHTLIWGRFLEVMIESTPQALFNLFLIFKNYNSATMFDLSRYYLSTTFSIINLALGLVSFEIYRYQYKNINENKDNSKKFIEGVKKLSYLSPYVIVLTLFRFFDISSRMIFIGLLSYITKTGFSIIYFLLADFVLIGYLQHLVDFLPINDDYKTGRIINFKENLADKPCCKKKFVIFEHLILYPLEKIGSLITIWKPFSTKIFINKNDLYHYHIKFLTELFCISMIIYKFIESNYDLTFIILSSISITGFIVKYILLYFIKKWNRCNYYGERRCTENNDNFIKKFKTIKCC